MFDAFTLGTFGFITTATSGGVPIDAPDDTTLLSVQPLGSSSLALNWTFVPMVSGFDIYRSLQSSPISGFSYVNTSTALTYVDSGLTSGTTYYYYVISVNQGGASSGSNVVGNTTILIDDSQRMFYYPKSTRRVIVALLDKFNDIHIKQFAKDGSIVKDIPVPLNFSPVEKIWMVKMRDASSFPSAFKNAPLPRLALSLEGISYDPNRAYSVLENREFYNSDYTQNELDEMITEVSPSPYNLSFALYIRTSALGDYFQIIEQLLPYYNPSLFLRVKEFDFLNIERNLQVILDSVVYEPLQEETDENSRYVNGQINFTVQAFMYRPLSVSKIIKKIKANYTVNESITGSSLVDAYTMDAFGISGTSY